MQLHESHKRILSQLLQGEAWKVVMHVIGERLASLEMQIRQQGLDRDHRLTMMERRNELLDLINVLYVGGGEENPYVLANGALWATRFKLPTEQIEPEDALLNELVKTGQSVRQFEARRQGGGVA